MAVLTALRTVTIPHGEIIPVQGQGTWQHVRENRLALDMHLSTSDFAEIDYAFPPPTQK